MVRDTSITIAGVRIDAVGRRSAAARIVAAAVERRTLAVHLCNAYVLALAAEDQSYAAILSRGDLNLADGAPVAWLARRVGLHPRERPSGVELVQEVAQASVSRELRHYLYGSTDEVVGKMAENLGQQFPGICIADADAPPFGPVTEAQLDDLAERLRATRAEILWVGLGTPKQDAVVDRMVDRFAGPIVPVGAAFDFVAGVKPRAPRWFRRAGLEWAYRLASEPRRLWRRYLWGNTRFLWTVARERSGMRRR